MLVERAIDEIDAIPTVFLGYGLFVRCRQFLYCQQHATLHQKTRGRYGAMEQCLVNSARCTATLENLTLSSIEYRREFMAETSGCVWRRTLKGILPQQVRG